MPCSLVNRLNVVKISIFPNRSIDSLQPAELVFQWTDESMLKYRWKCKSSRRIKTVLRKITVGSLTTLFHIVLWNYSNQDNVVLSTWYFQWSRLESLEIEYKYMDYWFLIKYKSNSVEKG